MQSDILFDNIYVGHSVDDAEKLQKETFDIKHAIEKQEEEITKSKEPEEKKPSSQLNFKDDPLLYAREKIELFATIFRVSPIEAIKFVPEVAGGILALSITVIAILMSVIGLNSATIPEPVKDAGKKAKEVAVDAKDKATEAVASGAGAVKAETQKRTTRSKPAE
jgi:calnexin